MDATPTGLAPTELGSAIEETEAHTAWSLDDGEDWPEHRLTPNRITLLAVVASAIIIGVAGAVAWTVLHGRSETLAAAPAPSAQPTPSSTAAIGSSPSSAAPLPARPEKDEPVTLPMDAYGQVHVRTVSGRTVCAMTAGDVQCNVNFTKELGPINEGMPATGVGINSRGAFQWLYGDPGDPEYVTMNYGTVYHAMGWIITPTSQATTFMYDATGHGGVFPVNESSLF